MSFRSAPCPWPVLTGCHHAGSPSLAFWWNRKRFIFGVSQTAHGPLKWEMGFVYNTEMTFLYSSIRAVLNPSIILRKIAAKLPIDVELKERIDAFRKPQYAWGLFGAARVARSLNIDRISAVEFGVAAGNGLLEMDRIASLVQERFSVQVDVYGFDTSKGLPPVLDYRDMPHHWRQGDFPMSDWPALQRKLKNGKLIIGDVADTIDDFIAQPIAPLGFISFDFDYYSSTKIAFKVFCAGQEKRLPRIHLYFDDLAGMDEQCEYVGEMLAITEYNEALATKKIAKITGFEHGRTIPMPWNIGAYMFHDFDHVRYSDFVGPVNGW
jgi:hypothetical protein